MIGCLAAGAATDVWQCGGGTVTPRAGGLAPAAVPLPPHPPRLRVDGERSGQRGVWLA
jgi:hypothetical protein